MTEEQKEICGFQVTFVADIQPERTATGEVKDCTPESVSFYPDEAFNPYGKGPFCRFRVRGLGRQAGVYVLSIDDIIVYAGKRTNLAQRFGPRGYGVIHTANCFSNGQSTNCRLNHFIFKAASAGKRIETLVSPDASARYCRGPDPRG